MWKCQLSLYSLSCWERPPKSLDFEIACSINVKSKQKIKRRDWWEWFWLWKGEWLFLSWDHRAGIFRACEQVMTGYKRVFLLLNSMFLIPLLQPWVSFSIPSVHTPVSQGCCLDQVGARCHSPSCCALVCWSMSHRENTFSFLGCWLSGQLTVLYLLLTRFINLSRADWTEGWFHPSQPSFQEEPCRQGFSECLLLSFLSVTRAQ